MKGDFLSGRLYQYNTLGRLMSGDFDGKFTLGPLLKENTIGIGTFHASDGELIILEGEAYKIDAEGKIESVPYEEEVPYVALTHFVPGKVYSISEPVEFNGSIPELDKYIDNEAQFYAIKITGEFSFIKTRSLKEQSKPYPRLVEVARDQALFEARQKEGVIVGVYSPELFGTIASSGYHLHFLGKDHNFGGHVLNFTLENGTIEIHALDILEQHLPTSDKNSNEQLDFQQLLSEIDEAE